MEYLFLLLSFLKTQAMFSSFSRVAARVSLLPPHWRLSWVYRLTINPFYSALHGLNPSKLYRLQRYLSILNKFISDIIHIKVSQNIVVECTSQPAFAIQVDTYDLPKTKQTKENEAMPNSREIRSFSNLSMSNNNSKICNISMSYSRPFMRKSIFNSLYCLNNKIDHL